MTPASFKNGFFQKSILKNGLRVITEKIPSVRSISIGVWIDVGSRNEKPNESGLSHFIEHMVFKGTSKRDVKQIAASLESLGGSLNGFTSREHTCYVARVLDEFLDEAVDVLADLSCNATFKPTHMKREALVICEEIKEVFDNPSDRVHDLFSKTYWGKDPLGQPIMGDDRVILGMTRTRLLDFYKRHYIAGSVVVAACGSVSHNRLVKLVKEKFSFENLPANPEPEARRTREKDFKVVRIRNKQAHLCLGFPGVGYSDDMKLAAQALNIYLGDGMSSILFQKIREERGLAYSVYTFNDHYRDCGIFGVYLGTDDRQLRRAYDVVMKELRLARKKTIPGTLLEQIKAQLKGNLILSMESTSGRMSRIARQELIDGRYRTVKQLINKINRLSGADIVEAANRILDESRIAVTVLGPVDRDIFKDVG